MTRRSFVVLFCALLVVPGVMAKKKDKRRQSIAPPSSHLWVNHKLGIDYAHWLVGARAWMASVEEVGIFLTLENDEQARQFEEEFWLRRDPNPSALFGGPRQTFDDRAEVADERYGEGTRRGRKTDRGAIFVLYGEPASVEIETSVDPREPPLEIWSYSKSSDRGLDGRSPPPRLYFALAGDKAFITAPRSRRSRIRAER